MSGHQPSVGHGAVAERVLGGPGGVAAYPSPPQTNATVCGQWEASSNTGRQQPTATAASRAPAPEVRRKPDHPNHRGALPAAAARLHPPPGRWPGRDTTKPRDHQPHRIVL